MLSNCFENCLRMRTENTKISSSQGMRETKIQITRHIRKNLHQLFESCAFMSFLVIVVFFCIKERTNPISSQWHLREDDIYCSQMLMHKQKNTITKIFRIIIHHDLNHRIRHSFSYLNFGFPHSWIQMREP